MWESRIESAAKHSIRRAMSGEDVEIVFADSECPFEMGNQIGKTNLVSRNQYIVSLILALSKDGKFDDEGRKISFEEGSITFLKSSERPDRIEDLYNELATK